MTINTKQCNPENYGGKRASTLFIVIHFTSNKGDTAKNNADYFAREKVGASAHFFVDENDIWSSVPEDSVAWHCGAKSYVHPVCRNNNSVGVEICMNDKYGDVRQKSIDHTVSLVRYLMDKYGVGIDNVIRHHDVTGKYCPGPMVDNVSLWHKFKQALEDYEVVKNKIIEIDGKKYPCEAIEKDGANFIKMRSLEQAGFTIGFDAVQQMPSMVSPCKRDKVYVTPETEDAVNIIKEKCGLSDETVKYLMQYKYGNDLVIKLAEGMKEKEE